MGVRETSLASEWISSSGSNSGLTTTTPHSRSHLQQECGAIKGLMVIFGAVCTTIHFEAENASPNARTARPTYATVRLPHPHLMQTFRKWTLPQATLGCLERLPSTSAFRPNPSEALHRSSFCQMLRHLPCSTRRAFSVLAGRDCTEAPVASDCLSRNFLSGYGIYSADLRRDQLQAAPKPSILDFNSSPATSISFSFRLYLERSFTEGTGVHAPRQESPDTVKTCIIASEIRISHASVPKDSKPELCSASVF